MAHRYAATLMGVNVNNVYAIAFGLGTAFVGIAAGLLAPQYPVFPTVGTYFVLTAFVIVVLGGLGSLYGAVAGSMIIGIVDTLAGYYVAPDLRRSCISDLPADPRPASDRPVRRRHGMNGTTRRKTCSPIYAAPRAMSA